MEAAHRCELLHININPQDSILESGFTPCPLKGKFGVRFFFSGFCKPNFYLVISGGLASIAVVAFEFGRFQILKFGCQMYRAIINHQLQMSKIQYILTRNSLSENLFSFEIRISKSTFRKKSKIQNSKCEIE
jgi:hypothetical protein